MRSQPWLSSPVKESIFILAPALVPVALVFIFKDYFEEHSVDSLWWIILVLCIDVSHVYSTLFRMYWDRSIYNKYKNTLIAIPVVAFVAGFAVHYFDAQLFWRILAYIAVFHFVRQQYGFMRLYSRKESPSKTEKIIDTIAIYTATLYPLLCWHIHYTEQLSWFVKGDFISLKNLPVDTALTLIYVTVIIVYLVKEARVVHRSKLFNIPKNMIMVGTYVSWYVGIIAFQGDLIFTLLNVVAHGIPYMALIWIYGEKKTPSAFSFTAKGIVIFLGVLIALAYVEEFFWDVFVWKDHVSVFPVLGNAAPVENTILLSLIVPLLVLPQLTHYVLDGFIWRFSKDPQARL